MRLQIVYWLWDRESSRAGIWNAGDCRKTGLGDAGNGDVPGGITAGDKTHSKKHGGRDRGT